MTDIEIWRTPISDGEPYEGFEVSNLGRIKSLNYRRTGKAELMNPSETPDGYFRVGLRKNGETNFCYVHRLVAETFLPNPEGKPCVNHKIEGKKGKTMNMVIFNEDESVDEERTTIEWTTYEENNNYATRNERIAKANKGKHHTEETKRKIGKANTNGKCSKKVLQLSLSGELIREWESTRECGRNGFNQGAVSECCNRKRKSYKGFRWEYK